MGLHIVCIQSHVFWLVTWDHSLRERGTLFQVSCYCDPAVLIEVLSTHAHHVTHESPPTNLN